MLKSQLTLSNIFCSILTIVISISISCNTRDNRTQYSHYEVKGISHLTVLVDSSVADAKEVDNSFYMELMTTKDTFFVKPINHVISFPISRDSLTNVVIYYNQMHTSINNQMLKSEYESIYFPGVDATIFIDHYPFERPQAREWLKNQKDRIYYEVNFPKTGRYFLTSLGK